MSKGRTSRARQTLCWKCKNACGGCSWSQAMDHSPVPGWDAVKTKVRMNNGGHGESYIVMACPEFEPDARVS